MDYDITTSDMTSSYSNAADGDSDKNKTNVSSGPRFPLFYRKSSNVIRNKRRN
jgi:hypothetical protein